MGFLTDFPINMCVKCDDKDYCTERVVLSLNSIHAIFYEMVINYVGKGCGWGWLYVR